MLRLSRGANSLLRRGIPSSSSSSIRAAAVRCVSSSEVDPKKDEGVPGKLSLLEQYKGKITLGVSVGAVAAITYSFYSVTYSFLSLTPALSLKWGFFGGALSTGFIAAGLAGIDSYIHTRPETAFAQAAHFVSLHRGLKEALGGSIRVQPATDVKIFRTNAGVISLLSWRAPAVELLFRAQGSNGAEAFCFVRSRHTWLFNRAIIEYAAADVVKPNSLRSRVVLVSGEKDRNGDFSEVLRQASGFHVLK